MAAAATNSLRASALVGLGLAIAAMGIYVADADDAPGAAVISMLLLMAGVVLGVKAARHRLSKWTARTALAIGIIVSVFLALQIHRLTATAPLFPQAQDVPSVANPAPAPPLAAAAEQARETVRAAMREQNLPGTSVAVGAGGALVWAEGFGWRDIVQRTPVTPETRFVIGAAAAAVATGTASLGLAHTGADAPTAWSPGHVGEPEEDFPGFTFIHNVLRRIGLADPAQPLPGERATFYVPATEWRGETTDPRDGRRLMYMRDLACCDGKAFASTPSDLVRFALATSAGDVNGELAGGMVMSLLTDRERGLVVAVTSNITHADTASLARQIRDAFRSE